MDAHNSSDRASSSKSSTSSRTSASPSPDSERPQAIRQSSDTHVFPANPTDLNKGFLRQGMDSAKARATLRELLNPTISTVGSEDRARLMSNGLQWLLENSPASRTVKPLSREAIVSFNSQNERGSKAHGNSIDGTGFESRSTRAWLDNQAKTDMSPPL